MRGRSRSGGWSRSSSRASTPEGPDAAGAETGRHPVFFDGQFMTTSIYDRDRLRPGNRIPGPAVVTQRDSTTVVHPGHEGEVDPTSTS